MKYMKYFKRTFDLVCTVPGLILLTPLFLVVSLLIKLDDGGPVFFRQERIGYNGKPFKMWKFRTMIIDADKKGMQITVANDPRITKVGGFLRKTKIDELPQLINVVLGQMSLVGPRPEVVKYVNLYNEDQRQVLKLKPGITDPASIKFRKENELLTTANKAETIYIEKIMPEKIRINLEYASRASLLSDFWVIIKTIFNRQ